EPAVGEEHRLLAERRIAGLCQLDGDLAPGEVAEARRRLEHLVHPDDRRVGIGLDDIQVRGLDLLDGAAEDELRGAGQLLRAARSLADGGGGAKAETEYDVKKGWLRNGPHGFSF